MNDTKKNLIGKVIVIPEVMEFEVWIVVWYSGWTRSRAYVTIGKDMEQRRGYYKREELEFPIEELNPEFLKRHDELIAMDNKDSKEFRDMADEFTGAVVNATMKVAVKKVHLTSHGII